MGTIVHTTPLWHLSAYMVLMGLGTGALMQNLVLVVQNTVDVTDVGAASGVVSFFRSLGGTIGVAALGAVLAVQRRRQDRLGPGQAGIPVAGGGDAGSLDLDKLPPAVATIVRTAYADATGRIFLIAGLIAIVTFVAVVADAGDRAAHDDPQGRGADEAPISRSSRTRSSGSAGPPSGQSSGRHPRRVSRGSRPVPVTLVEMST